MLMTLKYQERYLAQTQLTMPLFINLIISLIIKYKKIITIYFVYKNAINSINDNNKFEENSVKMIYSLPVNSFTLVSDKNDNIYLVKISDIVDENILKGSEDFGIFEKKGKLLLREQMYSSYDIFLENKYEVKINQKTLERVKNYFK